jgi:hypothetical protein
MRSNTLKSRRNIWRSFAAVLALAALVAPAFAKPVTKVINIVDHQKIAGKQLNNEAYTFRVDDTKLVVELRSKVVAEATGRWEPRDKKNDGDAVVSDANGQIIELRFSGEKRAFVISSTM